MSTTCTPMTTSTLVLEVVTADGIAAWDSLAGLGYDKLQATPPHIFDDRQPGRIPVHIRHGGPVIGFIDYLEEGLGYGTGLHAVAVIEGVPADMVAGCYCSAELRADNIALRSRAGNRSGYIGSAFATSASLEACALVDATAGIGAAKVRAYPGDYRRQDGSFNWSGAPTIVKRAKEAATWELRYRRPPSIVIRRAPEPTISNGLELRYGPPGAVLSVH